MNKIDYCPMCKSKYLEVLKKLQFSYPGGNIYENLLDMRYVRLWILFDKILGSRNSVKFHSTLCKSCGFIFTNPRFMAEEISVKYATINELGSAKKRYQKYPPSKLGMRANRIYSLVTSICQPKGKIKILDYGGAWGYNLIPFVKVGDLGYILDYEKWNLPSGIKYLGRDLIDLKPNCQLSRNDLFDVILCLHTLEHAIEPMDLLQSLSAHLFDPGLLYVEVPLGCFREYKNINEPLTHVNFFSEQSLYKGFQSIGLNIIHLSTAYQWVMRENIWCVNIIGSKGRKNIITKSIGQQMRNIQYYWPLFVNKMRKILGRCVRDE